MRLWAHARPSALKRARDLELNSATGFVMPCHILPTVLPECAMASPLDRKPG
jgi:hypothetical protein